MSDDDDADRAESDAKASSPAKRAQAALGAARDYVAGTDVGELRAKAADKAAALYKQGRDVIANPPDVGKTTEDLRDTIRRNPLAAVGVAFTAGLLIALLTRG